MKILMLPPTNTIMPTLYMLKIVSSLFSDHPSQLKTSNGYNMNLISWDSGKETDDACTSEEC